MVFFLVSAYRDDICNNQYQNMLSCAVNYSLISCDTTYLIMHRAFCYKQKRSFNNILAYMDDICNYQYQNMLSCAASYLLIS